MPRYNDLPLGTTDWAYELIPKDDVDELIIAGEIEYDYFAGELPPVPVPGSKNNVQPATGDLATLDSLMQPYPTGATESQKTLNGEKPRTTGWRRAAEQVGFAAILFTCVGVGGEFIYQNTVSGVRYTVPAKQPQLLVPDRHSPDATPTVMANARPSATSIALPSGKASYKIA